MSLLFLFFFNGVGIFLECEILEEEVYLEKKKKEDVGRDFVREGIEKGEVFWI